MPKRLPSPLKVHGGKGAFQGKLANWIVSLFPSRNDFRRPWLHYVEPYFGGGSVLLANDPESIGEVANDLDGHLTNFWTVLQNRPLFRKFKRIVEATPFSKPEFEAAGNIIRQDGSDANYSLLGGVSVVRAAAYFIRCRQSMSGRQDDFAPLTRDRLRRRMNEQVSAWLTSIDGLYAVHQRMIRVVVYNEPALAVIAREDGPQTLFYLDPPYLAETRTAPDVYRHEMTPTDHDVLLTTLAQIRGRFLLSGYRSELYDSAANTFGWKRHEFPIVNNAAKGKKKRTMVECVYTNY